jgi:hypothetical protein
MIESLRHAHTWKQRLARAKLIGTYRSETHDALEKLEAAGARSGPPETAAEPLEPSSEDD